MTQEEHLYMMAERRNMIREEVLSKITIASVEALKRKDVDPKAKERIFKVLLDFNNREYTLKLSAIRLDKHTVELYSYADEDYNLSQSTTAFTADNKAFINAIKEACVEVNAGSINAWTLREVIEDTLFKIEESIQDHYDRQQALKQAI
jgi:hypothetical protein